MNVFKIAWRSLQHRGLGSLLTIVSMGLGVMMVVAVLSIYGLVEASFRSNNSFGYNVIVGARGGGIQLTLNSVFYLSNPVENIPYEYYLAFCDEETRQREMKQSIAFKALEQEREVLDAMRQLAPVGTAGLSGVVGSLASKMHDELSFSEMKFNRRGLYKKYTDTVIPLCLGDSWKAGEDLNYRCVGTKPTFFSELVLDIDTEEKFSFSEGRCFREFDKEHGYFECVVGAVVAKRGGVTIGQEIFATHGDPNDESSHLHTQPFTVVGILDSTNTPNDRAVFLNMEGFYLMEGHVKPVVNDDILSTEDEDEEANESNFSGVDPFADEGSDEDSAGDEEPVQDESTEDIEQVHNESRAFGRVPLPIEQREVTALLIRTLRDDEFNIIGMFLPPQINQGDDLEMTLNWTAYRPMKSQKSAQAVSPVDQVTQLFQLFVDPIRWLLLALTVMICVVSAISILVGIYNSMSQRQHEIAIMRALGANRFKVMSIMMIEAVLLACLGGAIGWFAGHGLNVVISPFVEARTGVGISFFQMAPGVPILGYLFGGGDLLPNWLLSLRISPELLLIPGLIILAVLVGTYPAISAYRTDVANSLGK